MKKKNHMATYPINLSGLAWWWIDGDKEVYEGKITKAIFTSENDLSIESECEGDIYNIKLKRVSNTEFEGGYFIGRNLNKKEKIKCTLYENPEGCFLFGVWTQDTYDYIWCAKLDRKSQG